MRIKHNTLKRIIYRCCEELKATYDVAKEISIKAAIITFWAKIDIQIMNRNGFKEPPSVKKRLKKKHQIMLDFLEKKYKDFWPSYKTTTALPDCEEHLRNKIWICWWQGIENAPEVVKACVKSIKKFSGKYEVICITEENYKQYVKFPTWIEDKRKKNIISRTIYSDLLRMNLLSTYGGIWIDSTFFCTKPCFETYMNLPLWSIKRPDYLHCSVASGYFANYSLGCGYNNRWMYKVVLDFLYNYWKENNKLIDYLLTDYAIVLVQRHYKEIAESFTKIQPNNVNCDELYKVLGQPFEENTWQQINKDTALYKLTWKQSFTKEINGKKSFYGKLIDGSLK